MEMRPTADFPDLHALLENSQVRPRTNWLGYGIGIFLLVVLTSAYIGFRLPLMIELQHLAAR